LDIESGTLKNGNLLTSFSSENVVKTRLPAGMLVDDMNDVVVVCLVSDSSGAITNVSSTVEVKPLPISIPSEE